MLLALALAICAPTGPRVTCVHDGDTFWWQGEKIRLLAINAPELDARRKGQRARAIAARDRLAQLLAAGPVTIDRRGVDRYGRTLATVRAGGHDVGAELVAEGLARVWQGRKGTN